MPLYGKGARLQDQMRASLDAADARVLGERQANEIMLQHTPLPRIQPMPLEAPNLDTLLRIAAHFKGASLPELIQAALHRRLK